MKIVHICLASHYTEGMTYQDNLLPLQNAKDGHGVVIVSDCGMFEDGRLVQVSEEDRILPSGERLVRMRYDNIINETISSKIRKVSKLYSFLKEQRPDVVLFHGVAGWEMLSAAKYKRKNPSSRLYVDSHEDFHNSGSTWFSRVFQYRLFNFIIVCLVKSRVDKFLYLSYESRDFLKKMYFLRDDELEFFPLGGVLVSPAQRREHSIEIRQKHNLALDDVLVVHSGKLDAGKRTEEIIEAFSQVKADNLKLLILGSIPANRTARLKALIDADDRIIYAGWKNSDGLVKYLSAADLYFQPGTQSATMQNAICCGAPVALYPYPSHEPYIAGNGFWVREVDDFVSVFKAISQDPKLLEDMSSRSYIMAQSMLDYRILAKRLYV